jgi:hypothetical protein
VSNCAQKRADLRRFCAVGQLLPPLLKNKLTHRFFRV